MQLDLSDCIMSKNDRESKARTVDFNRDSSANIGGICNNAPNSNFEDGPHISRNPASNNVSFAEGGRNLSALNATGTANPDQRPSLDLEQSSKKSRDDRRGGGAAELSKGAKSGKSDKRAIVPYKCRPRGSWKADSRDLSWSHSGASGIHPLRDVRRNF